MKKLTKIIAATGIIAGLGVAGLPLVSYATGAKNTATVTVNLKVIDTISITASESSIDLGELTPDAATELDETHHKTTLTITSNNFGGYTVTAAGNPLTAADSGNAQIAYNGVGAGTSAWGISKTKSGFEGLTAIHEQSVKNDSTDNSKNIDIYFGASTSPVQPTGTYTGTITFTATNK